MTGRSTLCLLILFASSLAEAAGERNVVLVTGSASGIGLATARKFAAEGWAVYGGDINCERNRMLADFGAAPLDMDVSDDVKVRAGIRRILAEQGRIDVLVANAGYMQMGAIECVPVEAAQRQFDVNVFGVVRCVQSVLPSMRRRGEGRIIVMSSVVGDLAIPAAGWYPASKHALEGISDSLRMEVAQFGIEVSVVKPGMTDTRFFENSVATMREAESSPHAAAYA